MTGGNMQGLRNGAGPKASCDDYPIYRPSGVYYGTEEQEQTAFFEWAALVEHKYPPIASMYHIPNGGKRSKTEAARLKAAGVKKGLPDLCLPYAAGGYIGLYIELKVDDNTAKEDQKKWLRLLRAQGHYTCVCYGWRTAATITEAYLRGEITKQR
jgi:hypothetical protein